MKFSTNRNEQCEMETMSFNEAIELYEDSISQEMRDEYEELQKTLNPDYDGPSYDDGIPF